MADPRDRAYAELIVDGCLGVQPGWQVLVGGNPQARPLLEELCAVLARRGAYALLRVSFEGLLISAPSWVAEAPLDLVAHAGSAVRARDRDVRCARSSCRRPTTRGTRPRSTPSASARCRVPIGR